MANDEDDDDIDNDEDAEQDEPRPPLGLRAADINAPRPPPRGWTGPPHEQVYAGMWACYRDGIRTGDGIRKRCGVDYRTAATAIRKGWPEKGWPPFTERILLWDKQKDVARSKELARDRVAATEAGKTEASKWKELQDSLWPTVKDVATLCAEIGNNLRRVAKSATLIKYRDVVKFAADGQTTVTISEAYVDQAAHSRATFLLASSMKELPIVARAVLGPSIEVPEPEVPVFTSDQLALLQAGELPEGVTTEMLGIALLRGGLKSLG